MSELRTIRALNTIGDMLVDALVDEFVQQGHNNTGEFVDSIMYAVKAFSDSYELGLYFSKYGIYQDKGVKANRIAFTRGSGAKSSKYIQALTKWVMQRGFTTSNKKAKGIAFAIANKHKREGMPSAGAFAFSLNGKRTGFFSNNEVFSKIDSMVEDMVSENVFAIMEDAINDVQKFINLSNAQAA